MNPAIIVIDNYQSRPRGPNIARASCQSAENCEKYTRLGQQEIAELSHEYMHWRSHTEGVSMKYYSTNKRIEMFLQYQVKGGYYHQVGTAEGVAECTAMKYLHSFGLFTLLWSETIILALAWRHSFSILQHSKLHDLIIAF